MRWWFRRRCEWLPCKGPREVKVELARESGADRTSAWLCIPHADRILNHVLPGAEAVDVFGADGAHAHMDDFETAARKLAIQRGIPVRQARRALQRRQG